MNSCEYSTNLYELIYLLNLHSPKLPLRQTESGMHILTIEDFVICRWVQEDLVECFGCHHKMPHIKNTHCNEQCRIVKFAPECRRVKGRGP